MRVIKSTTCPIERRRSQYPPVGDQLDAMVKFAHHLREAGLLDGAPAEVIAWVDRCMEVKRRNPK